MEKAAATGARAGVRRELRWGLCTAVAACAAYPAMAAQDVPRSAAETVVAQSRVEPPLRLEVQTSTLPRLEAQDAGFQAPRVDVSLFPRSRAGGLGAVLGMSGFSAHQPQPLGLQPMRPSVDLGLRWSQRLQSQQIDITAWRRMNAEDDAYTLVQQRQPVYGARFEMNLSGGRRSPFALERGFIGLQLEGGGRISVKRKNGGPMVYYRTTF